MTVYNTTRVEVYDSEGNASIFSNTTTVVCV